MKKWQKQGLMAMGALMVLLIVVFAGLFVFLHDISAKSVVKALNSDSIDGLNSLTSVELTEDCVFVMTHKNNKGVIDFQKIIVYNSETGKWEGISKTIKTMGYTIATTKYVVTDTLEYDIKVYDINDVTFV